MSPRARLPLAVRLGALPRRLVVDRHLALELHVVEYDHLVATDDGDPAHLVRVEPRQVHVRDLPGREAEVAEDDILDAVLEEVAAQRDRDLRLLVEEIEDHREVVDAERPERVLVRANDPEVLAVAVDAKHVAELAGVDQLLQLLDAGVVEEQVARHQDEVAVGCDGDQLVHLGGPHRRRLLDQDVLARLERLLRELVVRGHRRGDHDCVERCRRRASPRSRDVACAAGSARRTPRAGLPSWSQTQASSPSSSKLRARFGPQYPRPATPTLIRASRPCRCAIGASRCGSRRSGWPPRPACRSRSSNDR